MTTKLFEIRDKATFVPMMATIVSTLDVDLGPEHFLVRRAGFGPDRCVILCKLCCSGIDRNATYDPHAWGGRTYPVAHEHILANWDKLQSGDVIDVEFLLGETKEKKVSEAFI